MTGHNWLSGLCIKLLTNKQTQMAEFEKQFLRAKTNGSESSFSQIVVIYLKKIDTFVVYLPVNSSGGDNRAPVQR